MQLKIRLGIPLTVINHYIGFRQVLSPKYCPKSQSILSIYLLWVVRECSGRAGDKYAKVPQIRSNLFEIRFRAGRLVASIKSFH